MERSVQIRFDKLYQKHITTLKLQGKRKSTIDLYSMPIRRLATFFDRCPDRLSPEDLKTCFAALVESHSWSTVKTDHNGLQFFWKLWLVLKHVLPRRLRRSRDYGFLHSNEKKQLSLVQLVLNVMVKAVEPVIRPKFTCRRCGESMKHIAFSFLKPT